MTTITIDFINIILSNHLDLLHQSVKPVPQIAGKLGLTLLIPQVLVNRLHQLPKGKNRIKFINSSSFVNEIIGYAYISYDSRKQVCDVIKISRQMSFHDISKEVRGVFPNDALLCITIPINDVNIRTKAYQLCDAGFSNPHISTQRPCGLPLQGYGLCMVKRNDNQLNKPTNKEDVNYVLAQFQKMIGICQMTICLTTEAIEYLRDLQKIGLSLNSDGSISQKEIAGKLKSVKIEHRIHYLDVDYDSLLVGHEMGVDIVPGMYNFHSHPRDAYERANVKFGWPSAQDYIGFLIAFIEDQTILHMVTSIEGIYILSMNKYCLKNYKYLPRNIATFIIKNYDFCGENMTPDQYTQEVNNITYKESPLFMVQYLPWHQAYLPLQITYKGKDSNCFTKDETIEYYQRLYK